MARDDDSVIDIRMLGYRERERIDEVNSWISRRRLARRSRKKFLARLRLRWPFGRGTLRCAPVPVRVGEIGRWR